MGLELFSSPPRIRSHQNPEAPVLRARIPRSPVVLHSQRLFCRLLCKGIIEDKLTEDVEKCFEEDAIYVKCLRKCAVQKTLLQTDSTEH